VAEREGRLSMNSYPPFTIMFTLSRIKGPDADISTYYGLMGTSRNRRARAVRRRKQRMARVEHDLSEEQWSALKKAWGGCAYCGIVSAPLQRDCVLALSRGGRYTLDNIVPACGSCNTSKCNDEVTGWLRRKRLNERSFLLRHSEIKTTLANYFSGSD
jgi:5-methylcytosine-specific restriction endonuclease McrA